MKILRIIFSLMLMAGLGYGLWLTISWSAEVLVGFSKEVATAIITAVAGLSGVLYVQWSSKAKELSDSHRPQKIEVYKTFFDIVELFLTAERDGEGIDIDGEDSPQDLVDQFTVLSRGMIIWASPTVLKAWGKFRENAGTGNSGFETLLLVDDVLQAIHKDLGNSNIGLRRGDVIKVYLSNPGELEQ